VEKLTHPEVVKYMKEERLNCLESLCALAQTDDTLPERLHFQSKAMIYQFLLNIQKEDIQDGTEI